MYQRIIFLRSLSEAHLPLHSWALLPHSTFSLNFHCLSPALLKIFLILSTSQLTEKLIGLKKINFFLIVHTQHSSQTHFKSRCPITVGTTQQPLILARVFTSTADLGSLLRSTITRNGHLLTGLPLYWPHPVLLAWNSSTNQQFSKLKRKVYIVQIV